MKDIVFEYLMAFYELGISSSSNKVDVIYSKTNLESYDSKIIQDLMIIFDIKKEEAKKYIYEWAKPIKQDINLTQYFLMLDIYEASEFILSQKNTYNPFGDVSFDVYIQPISPIEHIDINITL